MTTRVITTILFSLTALMIASSNIGAYAATATKAKASDSMATQAAKAEVKKKLSAKNALKAKKNDRVLPH